MAAESRIQTAADIKQSRIALTGIFILCGVAAIYFARDFLIPVVLAFFIALTFRPAVRWLAQFNIPPWAAASGFATILVIGTLLGAWVASGPIAQWIADAPEIQRTFEQKIRGLRDSFTGVVHFTEKIQEVATPTDGEQVQEVVVKESGLAQVITVVAGYPAYFVLTLSGALVIAFFLMASGDLFYEKLVHVLPTLQDKKTALRIVYDVEREVSNYILVLTLINAGVGLAVGLSFHFLGMPTPILWAIVAFVLNFIPYIGPIAGAALSALAAIVVFDSLGYAMLAPLAYSVFIGIETQIVSPYLLSRRLRLNSVAILLALAFWAWAWGIAGIIVAVPLLVTLRVFCSHLESMKGIGEFLGQSTNDAVPSGGVPVPEVKA